MIDTSAVPANVLAIEAETKALGFDMASDYLTGSLLRTLAATKLGGRLLELGTGTGLATAWLLDGMDKQASLLTVDNNPELTAVAAKYLGADPRLSIYTQDGYELLQTLQEQKFDLIFADTWPGKLKHRDLALNLLAAGGIYIVDDMENRHKEKFNDIKGVAAEVLRQMPGQLKELIAALEARADFHTTLLDWSTGIMICSKVGANEA